MKIYIPIFIIFSLCSLSCKSKIKAVQENVKHDVIRQNELTERIDTFDLVCIIKDVVTLDSLYILYVQEKNKETIYKIISDKGSESNCIPIRIGNIENLKLISSLSSDNFGNYKIRAWAFDELFYKGANITIEKEYPYYPDLFSAVNLNGLCIIE